MASTTTSVPAARVQRPAVGSAVATLRSPRKINRFRMFTYIVLSLAAIIYILPFVWMLSKSVMSFFESNTAAIIPSQIHLENYATVLLERNFLKYFWNTVLLEILTVVGQTVVALMAAYAFARMRFPGRDLLFALFLLTIFIPATILLVPNLILVTNISRFFESINPALKWMNNWPALVIPFLANTFSIFLLRQFFRQIPDELWDAARIDGAGHLRFLFQIVVPLSRAAVLTTILLSFVGTWSALQWPILVTSDNSWRPIAVALQQFRSSDAADQTHLLMAASVIALMPILVLYFFTQKQFTEGIATTGLKG
jgi:ABC-type glycerol-3-phosphate transport system permease component